MALIIIETLEGFNESLLSDHDTPCWNTYSKFGSMRLINKSPKFKHQSFHEANGYFYLLEFSNDNKVISKQYIKGYRKICNISDSSVDDIQYIPIYRDTSDIPTKIVFDLYGEIIAHEYIDSMGIQLKEVQFCDSYTIEIYRVDKANFKPYYLYKDNEDNITNIIYHLNGKLISYDKVNEYIQHLDPINEIYQDEVNLLDPISFLTTEEIGLLEMVYI